MSEMDRVRRPLGLTIAIIATAILYGVLPLLWLYLAQQIAVSADENSLLGGAEVTTWDWLAGVVGGIILLICILTWWGHPSWIRFVLMGIILLLTIINLYRIVEAAVNPVDPIFEGQLREAENQVLLCQLPAFILVPLYVIWYLNRAPARAFYRRIPLSALAQPAQNPHRNTDEESSAIY